MKRTTLCLLLSSLFFGCGSGAKPIQAPPTDDGPSGDPATVEDPQADADIGALFGEIEGTFVFHDINRNRTVRFNEERARTRFTPASTFKIPNTLIGLETSAVSDPQAVIPWDPQKYPKEPWWDEILAPAGKHWDRDHTLRSAFQNSVVWYYRTLALRIGEQKMREHLARFAYGNQDISSGLDGFWLGGSLAISADEQVAFLERFAKGELGLSEKTIRDAHAVFETERAGEAVLYAKTGTRAPDDGPGIGWYVGFVEKGDERYLFAFNMAGTWEEIDAHRLRIARAALAELGAFPDRTNAI